MDLGTYLAKALSLSVLLETEGREVNTRTEDFRFGQDTDTTNSINLHLHVWVTVGIAEISQMRSPGSVLCISVDDNSIFIERVSERESGLRLLPRI